MTAIPTSGVDYQQGGLQGTSSKFGYEPTSNYASGFCPASVAQNISETEKWGSAAAGAALVLMGLGRWRLSGVLMTVAGGALLYRGMTGHCHMYEALGMNTAEHHAGTAVPAQDGLKCERTIVVDRPASELYAFWRDVRNLPRVMGHLKEVRVTGERTSHWVAEGLMGRDVEWDAEVFNERKDEMIAWRSLPGGDLETAGSVHFESAGPGLGTAVRVSLKYNPPAGKLGANLAWLLGAGAEQKIDDDLRRFKEFMEASGVPAVDNPLAGPPAGSL